jgi:hypothetical protein
MRLPPNRGSVAGSASVHPSYIGAMTVLALLLLALPGIGATTWRE